MKYTIDEILVNQIKVTYEDDSWALIPVHENMTADEIDDAVSKYDPDNLPKIVNQNISVGEERETKILEAEKLVNFENIQTFNENNLPMIQQQQEDYLNFFSFDLETKKNKLTPMEYYIIAQYFAENGDTRLKDAIMKNMQKFVSSSNFSLDELISHVTYDPNEILRLAMEELQNE